MSLSNVYQRWVKRYSGKDNFKESNLIHQRPRGLEITLQLDEKIIYSNIFAAKIYHVGDELCYQDVDFTESQETTCRKQRSNNMKEEERKKMRMKRNRK